MFPDRARPHAPVARQTVDRPSVVLEHLDARAPAHRPASSDDRGPLEGRAPQARDALELGDRAAAELATLQASAAEVGPGQVAAGEADRLQPGLQEVGL